MTDVLVVSQKKTAVVSPPPACTLGKPHITIYKTELSAVHQNFVPSHHMPRSTRQLTTELAKANHIRLAVQKSLEEQVPEKGRQGQCIQSCCTYHPKYSMTLSRESPTCTVTMYIVQLLKCFHQCCLDCTILSIQWRDFITNVLVLEQVEISSIEAMLMKSQLHVHWAGHISRIEDHHLPKITLFGNLSTDHLNRRAPKKHFKCILNKFVGACHIDHHQWCTLAQATTCEAWHHCITRLSSPWKPCAGPDSMTKGKGGKTVKLLHLPQIRPSPATAASGSACPALDLSAMSQST